MPTLQGRQVINGKFQTSTDGQVHTPDSSQQGILLK